MQQGVRKQTGKIGSSAKYLTGLSVCLQRVLRAHKDALDAGHKALLEKEILMGEEVEQLIIDYPPTELPPSDNGSAAAGGPGSERARELSMGARA